MVASDTMQSNCVYPVAGIRLATIESGIRYSGRKDLVLIELSSTATTAGVFTQNAFCAPPVTLAKHHLQRNEAGARYFLINTGNANAGTGESGLQDALRCCQSVAELTGSDTEAVLPFSTGVIGEALPVEKIQAGIPALLSGLSAQGWLDAAEGILTTDTRPKLSSIQLDLNGKQVSITGIAKGAGMIKPNMATMLAFVFTDLTIDKAQLQLMLNDNVQRSFNRITVDGDTSTNDSCMLVASGSVELEFSALDEAEQDKFSQALAEIFRSLAKGLIRDAEGASKFITIQVNEGASSQECLQVAYAIAESPLVKTACFASDPNWGRILAAIGRAGLAQLNLEAVSVYLGETPLVANAAVHPDYTEARGQAEMNQRDISITVNLARGQETETVWTSDLSHDYVRINAEYRT